MTATLNQIVDRRRTTVAEAKSHTPLDVLKNRINQNDCDRRYLPRNLALRLQNDRPLAVIAEIKRHSPSAGQLAHNLDIEHCAQAYLREGASAISVLTEPDFFGGSLIDLEQVRKACDQKAVDFDASAGTPVLLKDFVIDKYQIYEARAHGADAVLLVATLLKSELADYCRLVSELGMQVLVEFFDYDDINIVKTVAPEHLKIVGVNNRNLRTLETLPNNFAILAADLPQGCLKVAESGISTASAAAQMRMAGADALLVGEALMRGGAKLIPKLANAPVVKICGVWEYDEAVLEAILDADLLGLVFVEQAKRCIRPEVARKIVRYVQTARRQAKSKLRTVGLFRNQDVKNIVNNLGVRLDYVQLCDDSVDDLYVRQLKTGVIRQLRVNPDDDRHLDALETRIFSELKRGNLVTLDRYSSTDAGGTGVVWDWGTVADSVRHKGVMLAGGLTSAAVGELVAKLRPWGVDVSSGVETDGHKDPAKITAFIDATRNSTRNR